MPNAEILHVHNGDSTADTLRQSGISGEHLALHEALIVGPTPAGLGPRDWLELRASELAKAYQLDREDCRRDLAAQENTLSVLAGYEEIVLWFEHDLHCQTLLIYLLTRLQSLLSPGSHRDNG